MSSSQSPSTTPKARASPLSDAVTSGSPARSSPLRAFFTPKKSTVGLPPSNDSNGSHTSDRTNSQSPHNSLPSEDIEENPPRSSLRPLSMTITSALGEDASISLPELYDDTMPSTFRERSRSPTRHNANKSAHMQEPTLTESKLASSWWGGDINHVARSWVDEPKKKKTVPAEQHLALEETRKRVAQAVASALGTTADIAHEVLFVGVDLLDLVPIPGLSLAAKTLLNIWDAAQSVDMNRLGCLRLTERCADILISVREEVFESGDEVGQELAQPIAKLEESFIGVYRFMIKQTKRPWLKRYLRRDEILQDIAACDSMLRDALGLFGISIQIRILKQVQAAERRRESETRSVLKAILRDREMPPNSEIQTIIGSETEIISPEPSPYLPSLRFSSTTVTEFATTKNALGLIDEDAAAPSQFPSSGILSELETIHTVQNSLDAARDISDLRQLMRAALQTSSDAEILEVLQIGRREMPDAIKTLQRALERLADRDGDSIDSSIGKGIVVGKITRRVTGEEGQEMGPEGTALKRTDTFVSIESSGTSDGSLSGSNPDIRRRDTLDWEFIEMGIDCLRRMSRGAETTVPTWTITKYEVDREDKIGVGFFSDVYKGKWRDKVVAIKVLAETTPRNLFVREMGIWKKLRHPNVLPLFGASSATGDTPWFFVSPYFKNGTLVEHLKRVEQEQRPSGLGVGTGANHIFTAVTPRSLGQRAVTLPSPWSTNEGSNQQPLLGSTPDSLTPPIPRRNLPGNDLNEIQREWDLFRFMHEIAKGMEYLHANGVLHGDLKASNVLVDNRYRSVISDFGQSEMKNEAFRTSGIPPAQGTLRWQSPELMSGKSQLTPAVDVWAFSISCVEILTMGRMPWPLMDDLSVRHFVLQDDTRPPTPKFSRFNVPRLQEILRDCWQTNPAKRPTFTAIARSLKLLRKSYGQGPNESPRITPIEELPEHPSSPSPDMRPREDLPQFLQSEEVPSMPPIDILVDSLADAFGSTLRRPAGEPDAPHRENTVATTGVKFPEPVLYTPASSRKSSIHIVQNQEHVTIGHDDGYDSPLPMDEKAAQAKNERRYRLLLTHNYHPSLTLPLWDPSPVELGAVGYLSKPEGRFVTLFNAYRPREETKHPRIQSLPSIHGYGNVTEGAQQLPKKTVTRRALDIIIGSLIFLNTSESIIRRFSFPLKAGHKSAYLYTEVTEYRYMETLEAPKMWFQSNVDVIMQTYGYEHHITREDLFLIIGTLQTPDWALLVSHLHPEGHAHFNVYSAPKTGQPWGTFTTDNEVPRGLGPSYPAEELNESIRLNASKVSKYGGPWDAVLLARLRFKPDVLEPTSK